MSMIGNFVAISQDQLHQLIANPDSIPDFLASDDGDSEPANHLDIDKAWHGIHYLLTRRVWGWGRREPWSLAVMGGKPIGPEVGYGPASYLTPKQVHQVAQALAGLSRQELAKRYDPKAMNAAKIYPELWGEGDLGLDYLLENYDEIVSYYVSAAEQNQAILCYIN